MGIGDFPHQIPKEPVYLRASEIQMILDWMADSRELDPRVTSMDEDDLEHYLVESLKRVKRRVRAKMDEITAPSRRRMNLTRRT